MRTLSILISDVEYNKFGIRKSKLAFSDLVEIVNKELARQNLKRCVELAGKYGLSKMTIKDISKEVNAVRKNANSPGNYWRKYRPQ